jgi:CubicO group peptidase (beta-lactamase class C family)
MRRLAVVGALMLAALAARAEPARDDPLIGYWRYETAFDAGPSGELTLVRKGAGWTAEIGSLAATAEPRAGTVRIVFADGNLIRFRLSGGVPVEAFWQRRAMFEDPRYPTGASQSYATPIALTRTGDGRWRATVKPLPDPFTLTARIFRNADGDLAAAFRDPEQNSHGPAMQLKVAHDGQQVRFSTFDGTGDPIDATFDAASARLTLPWQDLGRTIAMTRAPAAQETFFPRPPGHPPYVYREPDAATDGWKTASGTSLGLDEAALANIVQRIIDTDTSAKRRAYLVHSISIAWRGRLVLDEYFLGFDRDRVHDMRSASKTFASVMLGAAMLKGTKLSPDAKTYAVLRPLGPFAHPDPRKDEITMGSLLTHSSGLACDDNDPNSPGNEETMERQKTVANWWKYTLDLPMAHAPGTHYAYCSANINLAGAMLTLGTNTWLPELFDTTVARPLQFREWHWNVMPNGEGYAGGGVFMRPRDLLKVGQTFLDGGVWNGKRIVSAAWVKDSTAPHVRVSPQTTGLHGDAFAENYVEGYDSYAWHPAPLKSGNHTYDGYLANGNGGQLLIVVPKLDLAVAFTAGNYGQGAWLYLLNTIVAGEVLPLVEAAKPKA